MRRRRRRNGSWAKTVNFLQEEFGANRIAEHDFDQIIGACVDFGTALQRRKRDQKGPKQTKEQDRIGETEKEISSGRAKLGIRARSKSGQTWVNSEKNRAPF